VEATFKASSEQTSEWIDDIVALVPLAKPNAAGPLAGAGGLESTHVDLSEVPQALSRRQSITLHDTVW
jgi:hypothetical protein